VHVEGLDLLLTSVDDAAVGQGPVDVEREEPDRPQELRRLPGGGARGFG